MEKFISGLIEKALEFITGITYGLVDMAFYAEKTININFDGINKIFFEFGISLIILKFLKKGFDRYVVWSEGDSSVDTGSLIIGFSKAIVVAISFPYFYDVLVKIIKELTKASVEAIMKGEEVKDIGTIITLLSGKGIFILILILIFVAMYVSLYVQFFAIGLEMLILRIGVPIACVGLMDENGGIFSSYIRKFFQSAITIMLQIILLNTSIILIRTLDPLWGIGALLLALRTPKFLNEFMLTSNQGGGVMNKAYTTSRIVNVGKSMMK